MQNHSTRHRVSDELRARHPYYPNDPQNLEHFEHSVRRDQVSIAFGDRCIPKLARLLELEDLSTPKIEETLDFLLEASKTQENKCRSVSSGIVESCSLLLKFKDESGVDRSYVLREKAARVVGCLSRFIEARNRIKETGLVTSLTDLLRYDDCSTRVAATQAISCLVASKDGRDIFIQTEDAVANLISALPDSNDAVNDNLLTALTLLTKEESAVEICLYFGCVSKLHDCFQLQNEKLYENISNCVWNIARTPEGKLAAIDANILPYLAKAMCSCPDFHVRRCCSGALLAISVAKEGKEAIGDEKIVPALSQALEDDEDDVCLNVRNAIRSASELEHVQRAYIISLLYNQSKLNWVYGTKSAKILIELLASEDNEIRSGSVHALRSLTESEDNIKPVFDCLYSVEYLVQLLTDENTNSREAAHEVLSRILENISFAKNRIRRYLERNNRYQTFFDQKGSLRSISG